jgi:adenylate cyclase
VEPAPELIEFIDRWLNLYLSGKSESVIDAFAKESGTSFLGTDGEEFYLGFDTVAGYLRVQIEDSLRSDSTDVVILDREHSTAWKEGTVGWAVVINRFVVPGRGDHVSRRTAIFHQDGAHWRIVHWHVSIGRSNEELLGRSLTTSVDDILRLVEDYQTPAEATASDGTVAVVFTDVVESTALMEQLGESRWIELLDWHSELVKQQTKMFGGSVVKNQGDGFMLAFAAVGSAAACAIGVQREINKGFDGIAIQVRMGIHSGNATEEGGDFFGRTVVVASRLSASANPGEILMSAEASTDIGTAFPLGAPRTLTLKGLIGNHRAAPLEWQ